MELINNILNRAENLSGTKSDRPTYYSRKAKKWENAVNRLLRVARKHADATWELTEFMKQMNSDRVQGKERNRKRFLNLAMNDGDYSQV